MVSTRGQIDAPLLDVSQVEKEYWERKEVTLYSLAKFNKPKGWKKLFYGNKAPKIVLKRLTAKEWEKIDLKFHNLKKELSKSAIVYHRITEKSLAGKKLTEKEKLAKELDDIILNNINQKIATMLHSNKSYSGYLKKVQVRKIDPFEAADKISNSIMK